MEISLVSDLHADFSHKDLTLPGGNILLLAGDLCEVRSINPVYNNSLLDRILVNNPQKLLDSKIGLQLKTEELLKSIKANLSRYDKVYSVLGNHEHYGGNYDLTAGYYREALPGVTLLENEWVSLSDKVMLFGATLWSDLDNRSLQLKVRSSSWSDYIRIRTGKEDRLLTPKDTIEAFYKTVSAITEGAADNRDKDLVIMTHFAPSPKSVHPKFENNLDNGFFHSNLDDLILSNPNIKVWCHGHTHESFDYYIGQCRVIGNPRGYPSESKTKFDEGFTFSA